jgi:hypothetical protein
MQVEEAVDVVDRMAVAPDVAAFVRHALGLAFEMRFHWERNGGGRRAGGRPDARRLPPQHDTASSRCQGELSSGLAYFRVRC